MPNDHLALYQLLNRGGSSPWGQGGGGGNPWGQGAGNGNFDFYGWLQNLFRGGGTQGWGVQPAPGEELSRTMGAQPSGGGSMTGALTPPGGYGGGGALAQYAMLQKFLTSQNQPQAGASNNAAGTPDAGMGALMKGNWASHQPPQMTGGGALAPSGSAYKPFSWS